MAWSNQKSFHRVCKLVGVNNEVNISELCFIRNPLCLQLRQSLLWTMMGRDCMPRWDQKHAPTGCYKQCYSAKYSRLNCSGKQIVVTIKTPLQLLPYHQRGDVLSTLLVSLYVGELNVTFPFVTTMMLSDLHVISENQNNIYRRGCHTVRCLIETYYAHCVNSPSWSALELY